MWAILLKTNQKFKRSDFELPRVDCRKQQHKKDNYNSFAPIFLGRSSALLLLLPTPLVGNKRNLVAPSRSRRGRKGQKGTSPVGVPRHVFVDALDSDLETRAAVQEHVPVTMQRHLRWLQSLLIPLNKKGTLRQKGKVIWLWGIHIWLHLNPSQPDTPFVQSDLIIRLVCAGCKWFHHTPFKDDINSSHWLPWTLHRHF